MRMIEQRNHSCETCRILIYTDLAQGTEMTQIYTISSKDTVKDVIKQILARNHLSLKDPNLFYLTYRRLSGSEKNKNVISRRGRFESNIYEAGEANLQLTSAWPLQQTSKEADVTLYSDAILSRTLDLTKDNRLTLHMQTGGVLKVYDSCFSNPASIRQFHIAKTTCSEELIDLILTVAGSSDPVNNYCLVEEGVNEEGRILRPKDYPLLIVQNTQSQGLLVLRRKQEALSMAKKRSNWINKTKPYFRRSASDKSSRTPSPVKQTLTQRLNPFPCIFKGLSRSRTLESFGSGLLPSVDKSYFIESEPETIHHNGNDYFSVPQHSPKEKTSIMRYMKNVGSRDKFVIFDSPNNENASDDLKCDNQASPANQRFSVNRHVVNSDQVSSQWSLGPSEGLLSNHGLKFAPNTPPLPPKSVNSGARYANVMKDQNFGSCSSYLDQKRTVEQPRPSRQNAVATESHKNCKPEKSASPILAFDANRVCENRQGAVRFQENIGNFSVWKKDEYFTDFASISQSTECNPEDHSERAHSTDSSKTPVPVHLENMKINHHKAADTANVHTTYDNGCNLSAAEYDVPADTAGQRDSSPISLMRDIYSKQKCFNGTKSPISSPHKPPLVLNAQQVIAGQQYQERKIQRGDRSEESEKEQHINPNSANYQGVNGDYDESFNDLFPVKCHLNGLKAYVSPSQANSPINLTLATNTENVSFKSVQLEEVKNLEAFTSSKGGEDLSLDKHRIMSNGFQNPNNGSHSTTSHLTVPTSFHDSDVNISSISKENMLTLATNLLMQSSILQQYGSHLIMSPNNFLHDDSFSSYSRQHSPSQVHKLYTYNLEAKRKPTNNKYSSDVSVAVHDKTVEVKGNNNLANLKPTNKPSNTKHHNGVSIPVHGCKKTQATVHDMEYFESYPSLFDVLHHCDIYRVLLDPNLPSLSDQLGLNLCLTKFPLDDVQRADTLQKLKNNEIYEKGMSNDSINSIQSLSNPKGPKARIRSRKGGAFQPVDIKRSDMGFDVVTIESIEPDSPASFEGSLAPGHIILEVDGKDLLRPHYFKDANGNRMNILDVAQNQLQAARQAALTGEIPHIRITAAQYHANFGLANTANNPERLSSSLRSKNGVNGKIQPISIFQSGNNNHNENNKCSKKHNNVHIDRPESTSQTEYLTQTHECYNTPRETPYQSEINSKSISELTDYSEDGVNSLKSKLIWFPHHKDEYSSRSPFDPRSPELSVRL